MECQKLSIFPDYSIFSGPVKPGNKNSISQAIIREGRDACRFARIVVPAIWMFALSLFAFGCGIDLSSPSVASSDPAALAGTWVGTLEENDGGLYDTKVVFNLQGQMSSFIIQKGPDVTYTGTVEGLEGSDKLYSFTLNDGKEGGLVADSTFSHAGIIIDGFSAGVLQKTTDPTHDKTSLNGPYTLSNIAGIADPGYITWTGNIMRVEITNGAITNVIGKSSTVTISFDGSFSGNDEINGDIQNTTGGEFADPRNNTPDDSGLGRYIGQWEQVAPGTNSGEVVALITPDKNFLGSYSCVGPEPRALDTCDFHLWHK